MHEGLNRKKSGAILTVVPSVAWTLLIALDCPAQQATINPPESKQSAATEPNSQPAEEKDDLEAVEQALKPILEKLDPKAKIEHREQETVLVVSYMSQAFKIHGRSMTGEVSAEAHEEIGPRYKGFVLKAFLQPRGEVNQAVTPQTIQQPYWLTDLDVTPIGKTDKQIYWALSYGSGMDKDVLDGIRLELKALGASKELVPKLGKSDREAIIAAANQAIHSHMKSDPAQRNGDEITKELWGDAILKLKPIQVRNDRVNVAIVLSKTDGAEKGLYVSIPISSYAPQLGDRFSVFKKLSEPDDKAFGSLYHYKLNPETKASSEKPFNILVGRLRVHPKFHYRYYIDGFGDGQECALFGADERLSRIETGSTIRVQGKLASRFFGKQPNDKSSALVSTWIIYMDVNDVDVLRE
jgi:hypothetical protein